MHLLSAPTAPALLMPCWQDGDAHSCDRPSYTFSLSPFRLIQSTQDHIQCPLSLSSILTRGARLLSSVPAAGASPGSLALIDLLRSVDPLRVAIVYARRVNVLHLVLHTDDAAQLLTRLSAP